jgi:bacterioferritin-associated ferredoxin
MCHLRPQGALAQAAAPLPQCRVWLLGFRLIQRIPHLLVNRALGTVHFSLGSPSVPSVLASIGMDSSEPVHPAVRGLKTICRCNNIKYRTIERAIRDGATTLSQIAARTTATTGHCGGSCTPEVCEMLAQYAASRPQPARAVQAAVVTSQPAAQTNEWWVRKK